MTKEEMVARKLRVDTRLTELKTRLRDWRRDAARNSNFRPMDEIRDLEAEIARLGQRSQKIQFALSDLRQADKRGSNAWFEVAAREILPREQFLAIAMHAKELRENSLANVGFTVPDPIMDELDDDDESF